MSLIGKYLCGCDPIKKRSYLMTTQADGTQRSVRYDPQGFEICPEHGERLHGWRSSAKGDFPAERKRAATASHKGFSSTVKDIRDNRDPQEIGMKILSKSNGHSN